MALRSLILSLAFTLTLPAVVSAASSRPWLIATGSWGTYSMSDVNAEVRAINAGLAGSGLAMDEISNGFGFGVQAGLEIAGRVSVGFGYERLTAATEVGDASGSLRYKLPANARRSSLEYRFPTERAFAASLGLGVGQVKEAGSIELAVAGVDTVTSELDGSGPLLEAIVKGECWAEARKVALVVSAGYRYAKVRELKVDGVILVNADGTKYTVDYSGMVVRLGFKVALAD